MPRYNSHAHHYQSEFRFSNYYQTEIFVGDVVYISHESSWHDYFQADRTFLVVERAKGKQTSRNHDYMLIVPFPPGEGLGKYGIHVASDELVLKDRALAGASWEL